jgi:site-specific DNA-methyltransferase (adenine-specific)
MTKLTDYKPLTRNPNKGTQRGTGILEQSVRELGAGRSILVDKNGVILAGNHAQEAFVNAGMDDVIEVETDGKQIVVVKRTDLDADSSAGKKMAIMDNRTSEQGLAWDAVVVEDLLNEIKDDEGELDAYLESLAKDTGAVIGDEPPEDQGAQIDNAEELSVKWGVELGQLWQLGEHRLICGDCTELETVDKLMNKELANLVVTDPHYNVAYSSRGLNRDNWGEIENDDMDDEEFYKWLLLVGKSFDRVLVGGGCVYLCHGDTDRKSIPFIDLFRDLNWKRSSTIIWEKQNASMGWQDYRSQHECLSYGWKDGNKHYFIDDRSQTTIWKINRDAQAKYNHPTQKPTELFEKAITNSSQTNDIVIDFFLGSGTTLIACERLSRKCRAVEISPAYCAVSIQRWVDMTGQEPVLLDK